MSTPLMGLILPTDGGSANVWDTILDTVFGVIDGHNHTTGQGAPIPVAALNVNADLAMSSGGAHFSLTQLLAVQLTPSSAASVSGYTNALFANSSDNNLYWRNNAGTNVQVTSGNALNVAGFVGGIGGDYTSVSALLSYDDASKNYWLQQEVVSSHRPWAGLETADVSIFQKASSITQAVTLKSPNSLAASYSLTLPTALPATTLPLSVTSAGQMTTAGTFTVSISGASAQPAGSGGPTYGNAGAAWLYGTTTGELTYPINVPAPCTITGYRLYVQKTSASGTISARIYSQPNNGGSHVGQGAGSSNNANNPGAIQLTETGLTIAVASGTPYHLETTGGGTNGDTVTHLEIDYTW